MTRRPSRRLRRYVDEQVDERDLDGYARQRVREVLLSDETVLALYDAYDAADDRRHDRRRALRDDDVPGGQPRTHGEDADDVLRGLRQVERAVDDVLDDLVDAIVEETCRTEVGDHDVDLRHATRLDCPACGEFVDAYHLGTATPADHSDVPDDAAFVEGWVCGHCETDVEQVVDEDHETIAVVETTDRDS